MTSLRIAEISGKLHKDVLESIRLMETAWVKINGRKFPLISYKDEMNRSKPMYQLSYDESLYVASKYDDETRAKIIKEWSEFRNNTESTKQLASPDIETILLNDNDIINAEIAKLDTKISHINKKLLENKLYRELKEIKSLISTYRTKLNDNNRLLKTIVHHKTKLGLV